MRVLETKVYKFDELSDDAKDNAREWKRTCFNQDADWHEFAIEDAKECITLLGFAVTDVLYTGFWSQGDGACFTGHWYAENVCPVAKMRAHAPKDAVLLRLSRDLNALARKDKEAFATLTHRDRYCNENTIEFSVDCRRDDTADTLKELGREAMQWIYRQLEAEYEYHTADAQLDDAIRANEYEFTESGRIV